MSQTLPVRAIAEGISVAPQLTPEAMSEAARCGFRSVINNRPDHEGGPTQPTSAQIESAARAAGLQYRFLPVAGNYQSPEDAAACAALLSELPRPVLMFCRSGARSTRLYELARSVQSDPPQ
jgi:sulfide:quinone oxidoreductase